MAPLIEKGVLGGKMLRPVLCRLVSDALDGDAHLAFECGMALELVHGGALIHDDWIDGDSFRRAAPALWEELGPRSAILIADLMVVDLADAQQVYEELVTPWMQVARKSLSEVPESNYKTLLEEVPLSFSNQLISKDKI